MPKLPPVPEVGPPPPISTGNPPPPLPPLPKVGPPPNYTVSENPNFIPPGAKVGDIIIARHLHSAWRDWFPGQDYNHAALVVNLDPFEIIEAAGEGVPNQIAGPARVLFATSPLWGASVAELLKMKWMRPIFPNPIREIDKISVPRSKRKIITETEARKRAIHYAEMQLGEEYKLFLGGNQTKEYVATKWDENEWYCALLIFKAYSRTITDMYIETENPGFIVYPDDLANSRHSEVYHTWIRKSWLENEQTKIKA